MNFEAHLHHNLGKLIVVSIKPGSRSLYSVVVRGMQAWPALMTFYGFGRV